MGPRGRLQADGGVCAKPEVVFQGAPIRLNRVAGQAQIGLDREPDPGVGLLSEPRSAIRITPGNCLAARLKAIASAISRARTGGSGATDFTSPQHLRAAGSA
jgi:hypothetical protein